MNQIAIEDEESKIKFELSRQILAGIVLDSLGKKEKLYYSKASDFTLSFNDVKQFYHLLNQKLGNDRNREIDFFEVFVRFDDDTTKPFNSFEALDNYHELKSITPVSIVMSWNVIVDFANSQSIETQKIELVFMIDKAETDLGYVQLLIEHTNMIWANEVHALFVSAIEKVLISNGGYYSKLDYLRRACFTASMMIFMAIFLFGIMFFIVQNDLSNSKQTDYSEELENRDTVFFTTLDLKRSILSSDIGVNAKILSIEIIDNFRSDEIEKYLRKIIVDESIYADVEKHVLSVAEMSEIISHVDDRNSSESEVYVKGFYIAFWLMIFLLFTSGFLYFYNKYYKKYHSTKAFILLTDESERAKAEYYTKKNKVVFYGLGGASFAILTGLLTSMIWLIIIQ